MKRNPLILTLIAIAIAGSAEAGPGPSSTVKISSFSCLNPKNERVGTGNLLRHNNADYVLASDHVIFHGDREQGICHRIHYKGQSIPARLSSVNALKGLALLKMENAAIAGKDTLSLAEIRSRSTSNLNGFATLAGFPSSSSAVTVDRNAQVLNPRSNRKILPLIEQVIEVKGHSEFGMSGGALFDNTGNFLGLLSHQYLRLNLGSPSQIFSYTASTQGGELIALAIPAEEVGNWLQTVLEGNLASSDIRFDVFAQLRRSDSVVFDDVRFTALPCKIQDPDAPVGGPRKGGDGAGIGGQDESLDICRVSVQLNRDNKVKSNAWPLSLTYTAWFTQLKERLMSGSTAQINGLFFNGERVQPRQIVALIAQFQRGAVPLVQIDNAFQVSSDIVDRVQKQAEGTDKLFDQLRRSFTREDPNVDDFLRELETVFDLIRQNQWDLLTKLDLLKTLDNPSWNILMQSEFESGVALRSKLMQIRTDIRRIRI